MTLTEPTSDMAFDRFLRSCVEPALGPIDGWTRRLHPRVSSMPLHQVDLVMASGNHQQLVCKSTSSASLPAETKRARPARGRHHRREAFMYERVLDAEVWGTPRCLGIDPVHQWLLLSDVGGVPLAEVGDLEAWADAARWLARFHADPQVHRDALDAPLTTFDEFWADGVWSDFLAHAPMERLAAVSRVRAWFDLAVQHVSGGPLVVVHGEFFASNVHAITTDEGSTIAPVDWESAAWGTPEWDLAQLCAGFDPAERDCLLDAYRREAEPRGNGWSAPRIAAARTLVSLAQLGRPVGCEPLERRLDWWNELCTAGPHLEGLP